MRRVAGMLILTRKVGQKVMIGDNVEIEVVVLGIKGRFVRLGIQAPKNVKVLRNELLEKDKR